VLVNNAGGVFPSPLLETSENGWDALYRANLRHVLLCTQRAARVMVAHGIRVNALAPDFTLTEGLTAMSTPQSLTRAVRMVPMGRAGHVDEMAGAAVFLASDMSSYVTGQTIHVDGGTAAAAGWYPHPETGVYSLGPA
jgi:3-oxoacyl-[acyl-carrier protein] reductase